MISCPWFSTINWASFSCILLEHWGCRVVADMWVWPHSAMKHRWVLTLSGCDIWHCIFIGRYFFFFAKFYCFLLIMVLFCFLFFLCGFCLFVFSGFSYFSSCSTCFGLSNITVILSIGFVGNLSGDASHCFGAWLSVSRWGIQSCFGVFSLEALSVKISFLMDTCVGVSSISSCFSVQVGSPHLTQNEKCPHMVSGMLIFFSASGIPSLCTWNKAPILDWEFVLVIFCFSTFSVGSNFLFYFQLCWHCSLFLPA